MSVIGRAISAHLERRLAGRGSFTHAAVVEQVLARFDVQLATDRRLRNGCLEPDGHYSITLQGEFGSKVIYFLGQQQADALSRRQPGEGPLPLLFGTGRDAFAGVRLHALTDIGVASSVGEQPGDVGEHRFHGPRMDSGPRFVKRHGCRS
jgi:hypothetical protein